jgi:PAS domain S-box-containing protein
MKVKFSHKIRLKWQFILLTILLSILLIIGGFLYYRYEAKTIRKEKYNELKVIADLKISQITEWCDERIADVQVFAESPFIRQNFQRWLLSKDITIKTDLLKRISLIRYHYKYENVFIVSPKGTLLLSLDTALKNIDSTTIRFCKNSVKDRKALFTDFYYCTTHKTIHLDIVDPISNEKNIPIAVLILRVNPYDYLYNLMTYWPTPSKTSEVLIVRKDGDSVLYVNELRHISNTALKLRIPLTSAKIPAVEAVLGRVGIMEGIDYRGIKVLADIRSVPGTPWFMVAKVDKSEIFSELYYRSMIIIAFILLLIFLLVAALAWLYHSRQQNIYKQLLETGNALQESQEEFKTTLYSIGDAVITTDMNGLVRNMNPVAEKLTGWIESEAKNKELEKIFQIVNEETRNKVENPVHKILREGLVVGLANHTLLISKDGKEIPIADSGAPIKNSNGEINGVVLVFRDQTAERNADKALHESRKELDNLFEASPELISFVGFDGYFKRLNPAWVKTLGYSMDKLLSIPFIEFVHPDDRDATNAEAAKLAEGQRTIQFDNRYHCSDGSYRWLSWSVIPDTKEKLLYAVTRDITKRKLADQELREREARYRTLVENIPQKILMKDRNYRWVSINENLARDFGFKPEEVVGKVDSDLFSPELAAKYHSDDVRIMETGKTEELEEKYIVDGKETWVNTIKTPVRDLNGEIVGLLGIFWDITERKHFEEAIQKSEEQYRTLVEQASDGIFLSDAQGQYIEVNSAGCRLLGYTREEILQKTLHELTHNTKETPIKLDDLKAGKSMLSEREMIRKDSSLVQVEISAKQLSGGRFQGIVRDITERKRAEEEIKNNEKRFRELIESLPQLFWTTTVDGPCDYLSSQWVEYTGVPESEQLGYRWLEQLHPEDKDRTVSEWMEKVKTGDSFDIEFRIRRNDGVYHWFKTRAVPMRDAQGNIIKWFGSNTDFDDIKRAEAEIKLLNTDLEQRVIQRTAQLESANKELEAFSYSVSHDLRAPLRHTSGYVELLANRFKDVLPEKGQHYLHEISDSVHQMGSLIDDLLQFSRTGRSEMRESVLDMNLIVDEVSKQLQQDNPKFNIKWTIGKMPSILGDDAMIHLVWINLLSNAVKFTRTRKKAVIEIGASVEGMETIFFVRDNGVGFDMKYAQKLFGVFQRLHPMEEFEGTGIGLANVRRIILRHGGRTWAEAEIDKGATFYFSLPKTSQPSLKKEG